VGRGPARNLHTPHDPGGRRPADQRHLTRLDSEQDLLGKLGEVLETLVPFEAEVRTQSGTLFLMRIRPYRTTENVIEGAVLTFVNLSARRATTN